MGNRVWRNKVSNISKIWRLIVKNGPIRRHCLYLNPALANRVPISIGNGEEYNGGELSTNVVPELDGKRGDRYASPLDFDHRMIGDGCVTRVREKCCNMGE